MPSRLKSICLISFLLFFCSTFVFAEDITITTYYPSPYGIYNKLQTDTFGVGDNDEDGSLDSGDVPANSGQAWIHTSLSIGTTTNLAKLHIKQSNEDMFANEWNPLHGIQIWGMGASAMRMILGVDNARQASYIQSALVGVGGYNIALNPRGGGVSIICIFTSL
jgi:hypothetical protein